MIRTESDHRGQGLAREAMLSLLGYADGSNKTITLTPTNEFGASKSRLVRWYKSLGFVDNKGRNKDYRISDSMYRLPAV